MGPRAHNDIEKEKGCMKKNFVRMMAVVCCVVLMASAFSANAQTYGGNSYGVRPLWDALATFQAGMSNINGIFSNANAACTVSADSITNKIVLTMTIQQFTSSGFTDTSRVWTTSGNGSASLDKNMKLSTGSYRAKCVAVVYTSSGQYIETVTMYSNDIII